MPEQGLLDVLRRSGGLVAVSRQLDITPGAALSAATALLPLVRGGFRRRVELAENLSTGLAELLGLVEGLGGGKLVGRVLQNDPTDFQVAGAILDAIFGSAAEIKRVTEHAAALSEVEQGVIEQVLPLLAVLSAGYFSARAGRMSPAERLAELGPLLDLDGEPNPLDAMVTIANQSAA